MTSPALQRVACEDYCSRMGYHVIDIVEDIDLSGRLWKRRKIEQVVQRIESGEVDVIVGWRWSRFSRNRKDWAIAVDRVEAAGGRLESATEPTDTTTSTGRLARGMLAELAAFESERIGDTWRETHARRVREANRSTASPASDTAPSISCSSSRRKKRPSSPASTAATSQGRVSTAS